MAGLCCLVLAGLCGANTVLLQAGENPIPSYILDVQRLCTLEICTDAGEKTAGAELVVYQVGKIDATSLSLSFVLHDDFIKSEVDLMAEGNSRRKQVIESLYRYVSENKIQPYQKVTLDATGTANLVVPQGAYLICQRQENETSIQATLVGVPCVDESLRQWQYQMRIQLKAKLGSVPTGDRQNSAGYAGLALIAGGGLLGLGFARKRCSKR